MTPHQTSYLIDGIVWLFIAWVLIAAFFAGANRSQPPRRSSAPRTPVPTNVTVLPAGEAWRRSPASTNLCWDIYLVVAPERLDDSVTDEEWQRVLDSWTVPEQRRPA